MTVAFASTPARETLARFGLEPRKYLLFVGRLVPENCAHHLVEAWRHLAIFVGAWHLQGYGCWAVEDKDTGRLIGRIGYIHPEGWPGIELAWTLGRPYWGNGFATEAARACLDIGFSSFGIPAQAEATVVPDGGNDISYDPDGQPC